MSISEQSAKGIVPKIRQTSSDEPNVHEVPNSQSYTTDMSYFLRYPNRWSKLRYNIREPAAEFLGTAILCWFGTAGNAQGILFDNPNGWMSVAIGWGIGLGLGAWVSAGISGGHINPAVTITMATYRGFPWKKVPIYCISQLLGGIVGAALTYANYVDAINLAEGGPGIRTVSGTAGLFGTYAVSYLSNASAFFEQFFGAFLLVFVLLAVLDRKNGPPPAGLVPVVLFLILFGLGMALGAQTGFAVNPARDLGPRILTAMAGYGAAVFTFRHQYWLWCGVLAPILGGLVAGFVYDAFVYTGEDSIFNRPNRAARTTRLHALTKEAQKIPSGGDMV
ncbi:aquaporin [Fomitiporia mediterranea MF3/22]|uniref:aquaporin n=1 Tax=Fomitiporia mediterranea (strain MF3/22) TaxID=694068 RepID=UPI00044087DE|nr:aquaporin [Fomitiporia mediterranea MF3/22]EJC98509.1 aquaporin [Fomitiporia mediterranea MF3/22]